MDSKVNTSRQVESDSLPDVLKKKFSYVKE